MSTMTNLSLTERRQHILDMLHESGRVQVTELSEIFGVSEVSIRNDLAELESKGLLSRVHGGAVSNYDPYYNMSLAQRSNTNRTEKEEIAEKVAEKIADNSTVMMNAGTTTLAVMRHLKDKQNVKIVTNSIVLALEGAKYPNLKISLLGGDVNAEYQFVYGTRTLSQLDEYSVDVLVLSADGADAEGGITTYYDNEADICKKMLSRAKKVIVALDYTKIGKVTYRKIADIDKIDIIITNEGAHGIKSIKERNVDIEFA